MWCPWGCVSWRGAEMMVKLHSVISAILAVSYGWEGSVINTIFKDLVGMGFWRQKPLVCTSYRWIDQWINRCIDWWIDGFMVWWFDGLMVRWFDGSIDWRTCRRQRELESVCVWDRECGFLHCRWKVNTFRDIVDCSQCKCKRKSWFFFYSFLWTCRETAKSKALGIVYHAYAGVLKGW